MSLIVCVRGGGDLGSGVVLRLHRAGMRVLVCELDQPLVVRRKVAFAEAVYAKLVQVEEVVGKKVRTLEDVNRTWGEAAVPVLVDPDLELTSDLPLDVIVDARLLKHSSQILLGPQPFVIGLGPGFLVGENCHAVVETKRGHTLGRVYWQGSGEPDSGIPEMVNGYVEERVLRALIDGVFLSQVAIGDRVNKGQSVGTVAGEPVIAAFDGVVRGLLHSGLMVQRGVKLGDLDPRKDASLATLASDKALAVGGGVVEAILSKPDLRQRFCD